MPEKRDHPRMRGEDVRRQIRAALHLRITPACAGKTTTFTTCSYRRGDHPRMRGEDENI